MISVHDHGVFTTVRTKLNFVSLNMQIVVLKHVLYAHLNVVLKTEQNEKRVMIIKADLFKN